MSKDVTTALSRYKDYETINDRINYLTYQSSDLDKRINKICERYEEEASDLTTPLDRIQYLLRQKTDLKKRAKRVNENLEQTKEEKKCADKEDFCTLKFGDLLDELADITETDISDMSIFLNVLQGYQNDYDTDKINSLFEQRGSSLLMGIGGKEIYYNGIHLFTDVLEMQADGKSLLDHFPFDSRLSEHWYGLSIEDFKDLVFHFRLEIFNNDLFVSLEDEIGAFDFCDEERLLSQAVMNCVLKGKTYDSDSDVKEQEDGYAYKLKQNKNL